jgi:hypothetical protein
VTLSPQVRDKLGRTLVGCLAHPTMGYPHPEDDNDYYALNWPCTGASTLSALAMLSELLRTARGQGAGASGGTLVHALLDAGVWGFAPPRSVGCLYQAPAPAHAHEHSVCMFELANGCLGARARPVTCRSMQTRRAGTLTFV